MTLLPSTFIVCLCFSLVASSSGAGGGPPVLAVKVECQKGLVCKNEEINMVKMADAQKPYTQATVANLAPLEKSKFTELKKTLTASSLVGTEVYALIMDPSQPTPVFKVVNTTQTSSMLFSTPAAAVLANTATLDMFPAPVGLVASTADGQLYRVDPLTGGATALPVALPAGHLNGGLSTTDGNSRLFLFCVNSTVIQALTCNSHLFLF